MNRSLAVWLAISCMAYAPAARATTVITSSPCDLNNAGKVNIGDVQTEIKEALGTGSPVNDMNGDHIVNVVDIQIVLAAGLGYGCAILSANAGPQLVASRPFSVYNKQPALTNPQPNGPMILFTSPFSVYNQQPALTNPQPNGPTILFTSPFSVYNRQPALTNPQPNGPMILFTSPFSVYNSHPQVTNAPQPPFAQSLTFSVKNGQTSRSLFRVLDSDGDGLPDYVEMALRGDRLSARPGDDDDGDGLTNLEEFCLGTDPRKADTDGDGIPDGEEVLRGTNPLSVDSDGDGYTDWEEIQAGTDPLDPKSHPAYPPTVAIPAPVIAPVFLRPADWPACGVALGALETRMRAQRAEHGMTPKPASVPKEKEEKP